MVLQVETKLGSFVVCHVFFGAALGSDTGFFLDLSRFFGATNRS